MLSAGAAGSFSRAIWVVHAAAYRIILDEADDIMSMGL
jgi:hypothetical protein